MAKRKGGGELRYKWLEDRGCNVLANELQLAYMQSLWAPVDAVQAVFCEARAGTGKTTLAVLAGAYEVELGNFDKLIYIRNTIPLRDMGFLPGTAGDKELPFMTPLIGALDMVQPGLYDKWVRPDLLRKEPPKVEAMSTAFTRGLNWKRAFIILDEAQSFDLEELQTAYTRVDNDCKVVTLGSLRQNDNRKLKRVAGLTPFEVYMEHFVDLPKVSFHSLETNYRGWLSNHADDISKTVKRLEGGK